MASIVNRKFRRSLPPPVKPILLTTANASKVIPEEVIPRLEMLQHWVDNFVVGMSPGQPALKGAMMIAIPVLKAWSNTDVPNDPEWASKTSKSLANALALIRKLTDQATCIWRKKLIVMSEVNALFTTASAVRMHYLALTRQANIRKGELAEKPDGEKLGRGLTEPCVNTID